MSKIALKKELLRMDQAALVQLLMDAYSARKEIKEYFDFFVDPNIEKLDARFHQSIKKEFDRMGRAGYCRAKVTVLKRLLKEYASFQPGFENEINLHEFMVRTALETERWANFSEGQMRCVAAVIKKMVELADYNLCVDKVMPRILALLSDDNCGSRYFRRFLRDELAAIQTNISKS